MRNTFCEINLNHLGNNLQVIRKHCAPSVKICAVIKANAYGHGIVRVAQKLQNSKVDYLAVAIVDEGIVLRKNGITIPILVMAGVDEQDIESCINHDLTITASSVTKLSHIAVYAERIGKKPVVHLKIDTGMGRIGVHFDRAIDFLHEAQRLVHAKSIICEGIYTHFSDSLDYEYTKLQFDRFQKVLETARMIGLDIPIAHTCSSRSIFMYPEFHLNMVRPGIAIYGIEPETDQVILPNEILPVLSWKTKVIYFKVVLENEPVGYGRTWKPKGAYDRIVTIPVGYADGFLRRFSNCGIVLIRGIKYPVAGRVCMDQSMVSLGEQGTAYLDDEVVLIGAQGSEQITAELLAKIIGTTPHEMTTSISDRVPRIYLE